MDLGAHHNTRLARNIETNPKTPKAQKLEDLKASRP